jgi:tRNA threonylcarbamoyladenosine biosynthesis protein TsaB
MKLILLDTCGSEGSVALVDTAPGGSTRQVTMPGRSASERLVRVLREAVAAAGWQLRDVRAIGVVTGPGSFTGVRVGLSAAKGLSEATKIPLIAVSRLEVLAGLVPWGVSPTYASLDAGRGEFYFGRYADGGPKGESLLSLEGVIAAAQASEVVVVCEDALVKALEGKVALLRMPEPTAADALALVLDQTHLGNFADAASVDANYLRRTDAEIFSSPPRKGVA